MANVEVLKRGEQVLPSAIFGSQNGGDRGQSIEAKIEFLEGLAGKVSNRRSRRWLNDRLLMELVPRLNAGEVRGLFAPPPWGDDTPLSPFCMTNFRDWDAFRNIDMDKEALMVEALIGCMKRSKDHVDTDRTVALNAWHRVDRRTREALKRNYLSGLVEEYEECMRTFIKDGKNGDMLVLHVQDPFHRLLLHGVCEFYDLVSATLTSSEGAKVCKTTTIKKKKFGSRELPESVSLSGFLKMAKDGAF